MTSIQEEEEVEEITCKFCLCLFHTHTKRFCVIVISIHLKSSSSSYHCSRLFAVRSVIYISNAVLYLLSSRSSPWAPTQSVPPYPEQRPAQQSTIRNQQLHVYLRLSRCRGEPDSRNSKSGLLDTRCDVFDYVVLLFYSVHVSTLNLPQPPFSRWPSIQPTERVKEFGMLCCWRMVGVRKYHLNRNESSHIQNSNKMSRKTA